MFVRYERLKNVGLRDVFKDICKVKKMMLSIGNF